jgi:hypothetical protein
MAGIRDNQGKQIEQSLVSRVAQGIKFMVTGVTPNGWMTPSQPVEPVAQEQAHGRAWDYPVGYNTTYTPRAYTNVSFEQLRGMADAYDLMRLAIETRKDQITLQDWTISNKDPKKKEATDPRVDELTAFFSAPDKLNDWDTWLRMLIEDLLVIDAATIYLRPNRAGKLYAMEIIDGSTISPIINDDGRTPYPPSPAYVQALKGVPATYYTANELLYRPRNKRSNKVYGMSPVEQVIMTVNIALRRQLSQLEYYTSGNVPEMLIGVPEEWGVDDIKKFQTWWDAMLTGNQAERSKAKFVPGGMQPHPTKEAMLKDDYDEWLARIIAYAFSISPQALSKMMNRATAEVSDKSQDDEGLKPLQKWVKGLMDFIITTYFGYTDLHFTWQSTRETDPEKQAKIDDINIRNGSKSVDEVRGERGDDAIGMKHAVYGVAGVTLVEDIINPPELPEGQQLALPAPGNAKEKEPQEDTAKVAKRQKKKRVVLKPIDPDRRAVIQHTNKLRRFLAKFLRQEGKRISKAIAQQYKKELNKADDIDDDLSDDEINAKAAKVLSALELTGWAVIIDDVYPLLDSIAKDGAKMAAMQLAAIPDSEDDLVGRADKRTVDYAKARAAELVGMRRTKSGKFIENPSAKWAITDGTREMLNGLVVKAMQEGWSNDHLKDEILSGYPFSASRAETIARTEINRADSQGSLIAYQESGVIQGKRSILSFDYDDDDVCLENADAGVIPLDEPFPSGDLNPPYHPRCRCTLDGVTIDEVSEEG